MNVVVLASATPAPLAQKAGLNFVMQCKLQHCQTSGTVNKAKRVAHRCQQVSLDIVPVSGATSGTGKHTAS